MPTAKEARRNKRRKAKAKAKAKPAGRLKQTMDQEVRQGFAAAMGTPHVALGISRNQYETRVVPAFVAAMGTFGQAMRVFESVTPPDKTVQSLRDTAHCLGIMAYVAVSQAAGLSASAAAQRIVAHYGHLSLDPGPLGVHFNWAIPGMGPQPQSQASA